MRRAAAVVAALLVSAVLLHLTTPHENTVPRTVSEQTSMQLDIGQVEALVPGCFHALSVEHQNNDDGVKHRLVLATRSQSLDAPPPAEVAVDRGWGAALAGPVHACTARDRCSPSAAVAPTCAVLQTFRC
ncbi:MAG: hypothetical protein M3Y48_12505 [Actinomycetota bacterium]|nr:hypothetical protein [Actinomycetota bacterium]